LHLALILQVVGDNTASQAQYWQLHGRHQPVMFDKTSYESNPRTHTDTGYRQPRQNLPDRDMARTHQDLENPGDVYPIFHFDSTNFSGNLLMDAS
jgi:hypothetical protein